MNYILKLLLIEFVFLFVVKVDCTPNDMIVTFSFSSSFEGRIYATGNPQSCFEMGNGQNQVVLRILLSSVCGTIVEVSITRGNIRNYTAAHKNFPKTKFG